MDKPAVDEAGAVGQFLEPVFGILALEKDDLKDPHAKRMDAEPGDHIAFPIEGSDQKETLTSTVLKVYDLVQSGSVQGDTPQAEDPAAPVTSEAAQ